VGGERGDPNSYVNTLLEVTKDENIVLAWEQMQLQGTVQPASVAYATFYNSANQVGPTEVLQANVGNTIPTTPDSSLPGGVASLLDPANAGGVVDLGGIAVDPSDDSTVWMSNAYVNKGNYTEVVGAVIPVP
jgi:hypothetical protein